MSQVNNETTQLVSIEHQRNERLANEVKEHSSFGYPAYSFKDKMIFTPEGGIVQSKELSAIILSAPYDITVYDGAFDAANIVPPIASAFGLRYEELRFSANSREDLAGELCATHPYCQYNSAPNGGKGKLAREKRKLYMLPAVASEADILSLTADDVYTLLVPPASLTAFSRYVGGLVKIKKSLVMEHVTKIKINSSKPTSLEFSTIAQFKDPAILNHLFLLSSEVEARFLSEWETRSTTPLVMNDEPTKKARKY